MKREEQTTTEQLKSMHIQINKQKCILKLFLFNLFDMHLMNILMHCIVKYFSYRKKLWISDRYVEEFGLKFRKREYYCHIFVYRFLNSDIWAPKIHISLILKSS